MSPAPLALDGARPPRAGLATWLSLVRFRHSVFALPFAGIGAWLAAEGAPDARTLLLVVLCAVLARTSAMAFNRWLDRDVDAANPRTRGRELPRGALRPRAVLALALLAGAVFVAGALLLNALSGALAAPVLLVLWGYSACKRVSWASHAVLGLALALAPLGAWVGVRGTLAGLSGAPLLLAGGVLLWVAGFDLVYACQDADFDRAQGLFSVPARFGVRAALALSALAHVGAFALFALFARACGGGWILWGGLAVAAALLAWQHALVRPGDLTRVDLAFFTLNGWVSVALFGAFLLDRPWERGA